MNIKFYNLGKIKETELDLRPMTVIIGPNNSNKTYIAYSIYALWENLGDLHIRFNGKQIERNLWSLPIDNCISLLQTNYSLKNAALGNLENFFQDSSHQLFAKTRFGLTLSNEEIRQAIDRIVATKVSLRKDQALSFSIKEDTLSVQAEGYNLQSPREHLIDSALSAVICQTIFPFPLALPAERNAFVLIYKLLSNRRYKLLKETRRQIFNSRVSNKKMELLKEQGDIGYPKPIEDFLDFLTDVEMAKEPDTDQEFQKLANDIERHIQNRNKVYLNPMNLGGKEIRVRVKKGLDIDLHNASSSIRQLAPLLLYLRYRAKKNDFLIIDEPEMNLHPESQAKLLEVFGIMVNLGVRILITTHSPYLMSHLNNLVSGTLITPKILKDQAASLYLKDSRAFLSMNQVSAYEMRRNKLRSLKDEDYGICWDTLSDVSSDIQQKYFEIYEKEEKIREEE